MLFRDLKAYQHARRVALLSRPLINRLPESERDLADQWRRACNSIVLNLAEGVSRRGPKEFRRFTDVARASLHEVEAVIDLVQHLGFFREAELEDLIAARDECARTVYGLLRKLSTAATAS
jgi:four helix bundle protein